MNNGSQEKLRLNRSLNLPLLIFYGLGVTIGAGIFALIGEVVNISGDHAPLSFLIAGIIAGATGVTYSLLSSVYPRAGGEAVFVNKSFGSGFAMVVGYAITATAIISSAVISLAFGGYLATIVSVPQPFLVIGVLLFLGVVASLGVREGVIFAGALTLLEVGILIVIIYYGSEFLLQPNAISNALIPPTSLPVLSAALSGSIIAFFAFIGFEDIVNMAEETVDPSYVLPRAIFVTLFVTVVIYVLIAIIAVGLPNRGELTGSDAPLATLFTSVTGYSGKPVAALASLAMVNGVLVQIIMASRVIYGMTTEGLAPKYLGVLHAQRRTPIRATALVVSIILVLALGFPLVILAQATSLIILSVFTMVNLALWKIGSSLNADSLLRKWRYWGLFGASLSAALLSMELFRISSIFISNS